MINSELLKEAIADAKAVRATALANAKAALEEAFTPKLQSMLAEKLKDEAYTEVKEDSGIGDGDNKKPTLKKITSNAGSKKQGVPTEKWLEEHSGEDEEGKPVEEAVFDPIDHTGDAKKADGLETYGATKPKSNGAGETPISISSPKASYPEEGMGHEEGVNSEEEISSKELEDILRELEGEASPEVAPAAPEGDEVAPVAPEGDEVAPVAPVAPEGEVAPVAPEGDIAPPAPAPVPAEDEEINLESLLEALEEENDEEEESKKEESKKTDESVGKVTTLMKENEEYRKTVEFLREELNDVNLLNAKLLYTNKLFKANSLSNPQKMKIIESFDLANSIREVKLTYAAMTEALNLGKETPSGKKRISITEGLASKPVATTRPKNDVVNTEVDEMASRFQKLAGIKKK